jgi:hypothetical protein
MQKFANFKWLYFPHLRYFATKLSEDDFEIKSKIYSIKLRLVLNHILNYQDVLSFRNLFFTLLKGERSINL